MLPGSSGTVLRCHRWPVGTIRLVSAAQPESDDSLARAWCLYNWANHAWATPVAAALIGPWMLSLVKQAVGSRGVVIGVGPLVLRGDAFPSAMVAVASVAQLIVLPAVGAHVDARSTKRRWLTRRALAGPVVCAALGLTTSWTWFAAGALFVLGSLAEGVSDLAWQGMLPEIAGPSERDGLSARGSAIGYFGGGVILAINLAIVEMHDSVGLRSKAAVRRASSPAVHGGCPSACRRCARLQPHQRRRAAAPAQTWRRLRHDLRLLSGMPNTARYVLAYLFFGDAVSAVISLSAIFLTHELVRRQHHEGDAVPAGTDPGYSVRGPRRGTARRSTGSPVGSTSRVLVVTLIVWLGVIVYAWAGVHEQGRSGRGRDCHRRVARDHRCRWRARCSLRWSPPATRRPFFSLYEVCSQGTAFIAPLLFTVVVDVTGSFRQAILSLVVLFVVGLLLLVRTDVDAAAAEAEVRSLRFEGER